VPEGGFFTWIELAEGDCRKVAARALEAGVAVVPGVPFFVGGGGERSLRISYSQLAFENIEPGIARLGGALP
jgi:2-aminoadipate transaminase